MTKKWFNVIFGVLMTVNLKFFKKTIFSQIHLLCSKLYFHCVQWSHFSFKGEALSTGKSHIKIVEVKRLICKRPSKDKKGAPLVGPL